MEKILYLKITKSINKMKIFNDILKKINKDGFKNIILYGDIFKYEDEYFKLLKKLTSNNFNLFIQIKLNYLARYVDKILEINNLRGVIVELDNDYDKDEIKIINELKKKFKFIGIKIYYEKKYGLSYLEKIFLLLKEYYISDLIIESDVNYIEENDDDKEKYFKLFIRHKKFLDKVNFQCTFIRDFRPNKCLFLEPATDILVFNNNGFTICPYIDMKKNDNVDFFIDILKIEDIKKDLIRSRLVKYIRSSKYFHCKDCINEFNSL